MKDSLTAKDIVEALIHDGGVRALFEIYGLPELQKINRRAGVGGGETEHTRHCSYSGNAKRGIVLHSAKQRSTLWLNAGADAEEFLARWAEAGTDQARDALVEGYF